MNGELFVTQAAWDLLSTFAGVLLALVTYRILEDIWTRN